MCSPARPSGMFFAELGAEVIKIENKRTGRRRHPTLENAQGGPSRSYLRLLSQRKLGQAKSDAGFKGSNGS